MASYCYKFKIRLRIFRKINHIINFRIQVPKKSRLFSNGR